MKHLFTDLGVIAIASLYALTIGLFIFTITRLANYFYPPSPRRSFNEGGPSPRPSHSPLLHFPFSILSSLLRPIHLILRSLLRLPNYSITQLLNYFSRLPSPIRRLAYIALMLLIIAALLFLIFRPAPTQAAWYDDNYTYRQKSEVTNSGSNQTDFQIAITLDTATLITAGKMQSDCDDIRITDPNGKLLPHVIEEGSAPCNNASTKIWVKVPSITTAGTTLFIYYGNPSAISAENGTQVFNFFENWNSNALGSRWTATGGTSFASGALTITTGSVYSNSTILSDSRSYMYEYRTQWAASVVSYAGMMINNTSQGSASNSEQDKLIYMMTNSATSIEQRGYAADGTVASSYNLENNAVLYLPNSATYYVDGFSMDSSEIKHWNNGTQTGSTVTGSWTAAPYMYFGRFDGSEAGTTNITDITIDWVRVRKYAATAPSAGSPSGEEKGNGPVGWWKFDEGTGTTSYDSSASKNNGAFGSPGGTSGGPVKIDDANDPNPFASQGRQVVRDSEGDIYAFIRNTACELWVSTNGGTTWTQKPDTGTDLTCNTDHLSMAIDANDIIHLIYTQAGVGGPDLTYQQYNAATDPTTWNITEETPILDDPLVTALIAITIDSNNIAHVATTADDAAPLTDETWVYFNNRIGGAWNGTTDKVQINADYTQAAVALDYTIDNNNKVEFCTVDTTANSVEAYRADANDETDFPDVVTLDTTINETAAQSGCSIGVDTSGNTWVAYVDSDSSINLIEHLSADAWGTWQTALDTGSAGYEPSIAINGTDIYVFYESQVTGDLDDIAYDRYNGSSWLGHTVLQDGVFQDVRAKWAFNSNNEGSSQIDYLYSDNTDVYWASLAISTGTGGTPTWQTEDLCAAGKCVDFDGTDDVVIVTNANPIDLNAGLASAFSISAWVRANTDGEGDKGQVWRKGEGNHLRTQGQSGSNLDLEVSLDLATADAVATAAAAITTNTWNHVVITYADDSDDEVEIYVNGQFKQTSTLGSGAPATDVNSLLIGGGSSFNFDGMIDNFKVYNYVKSASQIKLDYNSTKAAHETPKSANVLGASRDQLNQVLSNGLVGYWEMDESSGNRSDSSGNGNTLTDNNTVTSNPGKFSNAGQFTNANSEYLSISDNADLSTGDIDFTVAAWVYMDTKAALRYIMAKAGAAGFREYSLNYYASDGVDRFEFWLSADGDNITAVRADSLGSASTATWYFVVAWHDSVANTINIQVNNGTANSVSYTSGTTDSSGQFNIGALNAGSFWDGRIDEARFYKRVLSPSERSLLYNFAPGPVGYWNFDERSGTTAYDRSGNSNDGTLTNSPTYTTGKFGAAIDFAGSNAHVTRADDADFDFADDADMTIEAYIKHNTASAQEIILSKYNEAGYKVIMESDGDITCALDYDSTWTPTDSATSTAATYDDNNWHHVACVKSGASSLSLYIDGVLIIQDTSITATNTLTNSDPLYIGINADGTSNDWIGQIDEPKIYNYARTQKQIIEDLNAGHPTGGSPVGTALGFWKFDDGQGTTAYDSGANRNNGTLTNMASPASVGISGWNPHGKFNKAISFDGVNNGANDYVDFGDLTYTESAATLSWSLWVNPNVLATQKCLFCKFQNTAAASKESWAIETGNSNSDAILVEISTDGNATQATGETPAGQLAVGRWTHVLVVFDGTATGNVNRLKIYINGVQQLLAFGATAVPATTQATTSNARAGASSDSTAARLFSGTIDEMKIYGAALTSNEVLIDYNRNQALNLGTLGVSISDAETASSSAATAYCVPGDTSTCNGPVGEWNFEEGGGTTANDTSGNDGTGTLTAGPNWTAGKVGKAVSFDGTDDYVSIGNTTPSQITSNLTMSAWINVTTLGNTVFFSKHGNATNRAYSFRINSTGNVVFEVSGDGVDANMDTVTGGSILSTGTWYFVTAVYIPSTSITVYINGVQDGVNTTGIPASIFNGAGILSIGARNGNTAFFAGKVDQARLYTFSKSVAQVAYDYNRGLPLGHWKLDECQGTSANDSSGNQYHGTITIGGGGTQTSAGTCSGSANEAWKDGIAGKFNYSLDFDGTDDYVSLVDLDFSTGGFSVSSWFKTSNASIQPVVRKRPTTGANGDIFMLILNTGNSECAIHDGASREVNTSGKNYLDGKWHNFVMSVDTSTIKCYMDGQLQGSITHDNSLTTNDVTWKIGGDTVGSSYFNGQIDEVKIFRYALTQKQIQTEFNQASAARFAPISGAP